jgi:hypothetical protein
VVEHKLFLSSHFITCRSWPRKLHSPRESFLARRISFRNPGVKSHQFDLSAEEKQGFGDTCLLLHNIVVQIMISPPPHDQDWCPKELITARLRQPLIPRAAQSGALVGNERKRNFNDACSSLSSMLDHMLTPLFPPMPCMVDSFNVTSANK